MPNSIIWIALVAVWIFVLLPMLMSKRPRIMQTTDAALATRVLHRGGSKKRTRGPATGHPSDPDWRPEHDLRVSAPAGEIFGIDHTRRLASDSTDAEDLMDTRAEQDSAAQRGPGDRGPGDRGLGDQGLGDQGTEGREGGVDGYDDRDYVPQRRGRGGYDPEADAIASAARYAFRQRAVLGLVFAAITTAALAFIISSTLWWLCAASVVVLAAYMYYLRRQVQIEKEIRHRRMTRMGRSRLGVESRSDDELKLVPQRLKRPGAVVLEIDDEDPEFDHLDHYDEPFQQTVNRDGNNFRRASGA